jgi:DNA-binding HxlR family transcriptional regulator
MKRRELDGCPITGALQMLGDKWTMLVVRELLGGPKRTMELLNSLFPISSRTLVGRLRDMEKDRLSLSAQTSAAIRRTSNMR